MKQLIPNIYHLFDLFQKIEWFWFTRIQKKHLTPLVFADIWYYSFKTVGGKNSIF